jgi:hypothetical protein
VFKDLFGELGFAAAWQGYCKCQWRFHGTFAEVDWKGIMITEVKEQGAAMVAVLLSGPGANGQSRAAHGVRHLSFRRSIRTIRKRLRLSSLRGARHRWPVVEEEGFNRAQA